MADVEIHVCEHQHPMQSVSGGLLLCRQTQTKTIREREREGGGAQSSLFITQKPRCLPGSTHLITDTTTKTRGSSNATNPPPSLALPRGPSGNLATQHAVQISSGSEITEHQPNLSGAVCSSLPSLRTRRPAAGRTSGFLLQPAKCTSLSPCCSSLLVHSL